MGLVICCAALKKGTVEMERMRVTEVKTFLVGGSWRNWLIVKVETDAGIHGVGEATLEGKSKTVEGAVVELTRYIVGQDPFAIEKHFQEMYRRAFYAGGEVLTSAISGVETALWDIKGKALGVPVYELLGGRTRDRIKLYANAWYKQGMSPEEFERAAKEIVELGAKGLKFNPWGGRPGIDFYRLDNNILNTGIDAVAAVRDAVGPDIDLYIDCNGIFNTAANAVRAAKGVERYNISFFEEPVPHENLDAMAYVRSKIDIPVATGERLFLPSSVFSSCLNEAGRTSFNRICRTAAGCLKRGRLPQSQIRTMRRSHPTTLTGRFPTLPLFSLLRVSQISWY